MTPPPLSTYSSEIYLSGMGGKRPDLTTDLGALEAYANERMEPEPYWYAAGAAGSGATHDVATANGDGVRWFQLYWPNDEQVCVSFLSRARAAGYSALVVTVDTWLLGWRPHDLDHAFLPFLTGKGLATYFTDPVFCAGLEKAPEDDLQAAVLRWMPMFTGSDHMWEHLAFIRDHWDGPILLKGIQHQAGLADLGPHTLQRR